MGSVVIVTPATFTTEDIHLHPVLAGSTWEAMLVKKKNYDLKGIWAQEHRESFLV